MSTPVTQEDAATGPHKPVHTEVAAALTSADKTIFKPVCRLPAEPIVGPVREPPSYTLPKQLARDARVALEDGDQELAFVLCNQAFAAFATRAEEE